jgi:hypothetical protein
MKKNVKLFVFISAICLVIISGLSSCYYDNEDYLYSTGGACTDTVYTYNGRIKAIMDQNCSSTSCHGGPSPANGIGLETYADVKNDILNGNFLCSIYWTSGCSQMPKNASKLDNCSIQAIEKWKDNGFPEN